MKRHKAKRKAAQQRPKGQKQYTRYQPHRDYCQHQDPFFNGGVRNAACPAESKRSQSVEYGPWKTRTHALCDLHLHVPYFPLRHWMPLDLQQMNALCAFLDKGEELHYALLCMLAEEMGDSAHTHFDTESEDELIRMIGKSGEGPSMAGFRNPKKGSGRSTTAPMLFTKTTKQLVALRTAAAKKELKRRGRGPDGRRSR